MLNNCVNWDDHCDGRGVIRDAVCGGLRVLLKEDIYATAALIGSSVCYGMPSTGNSTNYALGGGFITVFLIRELAVKYELSLPNSDWIRRKLYRRG